VLAVLLEGAVLNRIVGPLVVAKRGLVFGLPIVNATGANVASDDTTSIKEFPVGVVSIELITMDITVMTAAARIATTAIAALVATDMHFFPVAAAAIVLAPLAVEAPVKMAAWTAIG
jgi:hypothetical protein